MSITADHVLIVEDDKRLNQMVADMLRSENYQTSSLYDGTSAIAFINSKQPDIVLLDMMLPNSDGLQVLRNINKRFTGIILMITARTEELLEVSALNLGVHDFLTKPVRPHILLAKLKALSRLNKKNPTSMDDVLEVQNLLINKNTREFYLDDELVGLTTAEYEILLLFMRSPAVILSREMIISEIRKIEYDGLDRSIDMRISSLRKKLDDTIAPYKYIKTVRGKGYILPN